MKPDGMELLGERLLVKRYHKPDKVGTIIIPDAYREDGTGTLWEFVKAAPKALRRLSLRSIPPGSILKVRFGHVVDSGVLDSDDLKELFFINAEDVSSIMFNTWNTPSKEA